MSVIGFDFGSYSCLIAAARDGGFETLDNDYSSRSTPSYVGFGPKNRFMGDGAKNQAVTNVANTIFSFKRLLGRRFHDPIVKEEIQWLPFTLAELHDGGIGVFVHYLEGNHVFSLEQITGMLLTKLKESAEAALGIKVRDCVISVPSYFSLKQRQALAKSASIAQLNVLRLISEPAATALTYAVYKKRELPSPRSQSGTRKVFFVDFGHSALQVFACEFTNEKSRVVSCTSEANLGGGDFDRILAKHFCDDFQMRYNIDPMSNKRAFLRLLTEVEKLKKQMSANSTKLNFSIECFMDKDVTGSMNRDEFEVLCKSLFSKIYNTLKKGLMQSGFSLSDIHSVEIVGGSSRIPAFKTMVEKVFGKTPSTSLNLDESVCRGCAIQCAIFSPAIRVIESNITDIITYPVPVKFTFAKTGDGDSPTGIQISDPVFSMFELYSELLIPMQTPDLGALYIDVYGDEPYCAGTRVAQFRISNINYNLGGICRIQYFLEDNCHVKIISASQIFGNDHEINLGNSLVPLLQVEEIDSGESIKLADHVQSEKQMQSQDCLEKERSAAKNALEEYIFEMRRIMETDIDWAQYASAAARQQLSNSLEAAMNWLDEEGYDATTAAYVQGLEELKEISGKIQNRKQGYDEVRKAIKELRVLLEDPSAHDLSNQPMLDLNAQRIWMHRTQLDLDTSNLHQDCPISLQHVQESIRNVYRIRNILFSSTVAKKRKEDLKCYTIDDSNSDSDE